MKISILRNATFTLEHDGQKLLVDPMLGNKASMPTFSLFRHKRQRNPIVELPPNHDELLNDIDFALITHLHPDHLDESGKQFIKEHNIKTYCHLIDQREFKKLEVDHTPLVIGEPQQTPFGTIEAVKAIHGHGLLGKLIGLGAGYYIELKDGPSIYIAGDTILTPFVKEVLENKKPDYSILACGSASLDFGKPILMSETEIIEFVKLSKGKVIANHVEALNHCPTSRAKLREIRQEYGFDDKLYIPEDGEILEF